MGESTLNNHEGQDSNAGGSMFREASNINISGGTFNAYATTGKDEKRRIADAMALLRSCAEHGAPYDAAAREDIPKCYEHTRVAIIEGIHKWAHSQELDARPLMWIYGPAGSGKTTIMQTVAETFDKEETLAASVFFSRSSGDRPSKKDNFVTTLAHQLALSIPALQKPLADALSDPSLLTKSLSKQLDALVTGPLKALEPDQIGRRYIFMVDGLDECQGDTAQKDVLKLLEQCFRQFGHRIRILVASRSLSHIQAFFSQSSIAVLTQTTPLDDDYRTEQDITTYFEAEFKRIRDQHPSRLGLPPHWPSRDNINILVERASGQFIYASVVMKFIADHGRHPHESLQTIIGLKANGEAKPYEELDAVYAQVLSTIEPQNMEFIFILMACMILPEHTSSFTNAVQSGVTTDVDSLLALQPETTEARMNKMSPLITKLMSHDPYIPTTHFIPPLRTPEALLRTPEEYVDPINNMPEPYGAKLVDPLNNGLPSRIVYGLAFSHASFPEYLLDQSRSKAFFLDMSQVHRSLALRSFEMYSLPARPEATPTVYTTTATSVPSLAGTISHCKAAKWTPELQNAVCAFDVQYAFTPTLKFVERHAKHIHWDLLIHWVDFILWCKYHNRLPSADADHILDYLCNMVRSVYSKLPSSHNTCLEVITTLLTLHSNINIVHCWSDLYTHLDRMGVPGALDPRDFLLTEEMRDVLFIWLSKIFAYDSKMDSPFFANGTLYANLALLYAQSISHHQFERPIPYIPPLPTSYFTQPPTLDLAPWPAGNIPMGGPNDSDAALMQQALGVMLSKSAPSKELAEFLMQFLLQDTGLQGRLDVITINEFTMAILIYLFECGVPYISEHRHAPNFDPTKVHCPICLLFDPFRVEYVNIELSRDPTGALFPRFTGTTQEDSPALGNPARYDIPRVPLPWLRIWILWLANTMIRLFSVAM